MKSKEVILILVLIGIGAMLVVGAVIALYAAYALSQPQECVGVIRVDGEIATTSSSGGLFGTPTIGSDDIVRQVEDANSRSDVKAVLLEVNSPGGSVVASKDIYDALREVRKPKVAYFKEVAASGGYYIAAGSDYIVSEPDALTGSIGVVATFEDMSGLFNKLGINYTVFKSGELKDMGSSARPPTEKEKQVMQGIINEIFGEFKAVVEEGRGSRLNKTAFEEILDARVLTGTQAKQIGLVDETGNEKEALATAAGLANISYGGNPPVCEMGGGNPLSGIFSGALNGAVYTVRNLVNFEGISRWAVSYI